MRQDQPSTSGQSSLSATSNSDNTDKSSIAGSFVSCNEIQIVDDGQVDRDINAGYYLHPKTLGQGTFGKVCLATHLKTFQHVAIKVINKRRFRNEGDKRSVYNEINCLKVLKHCNISRLLHLIENDERIYIVREYCSNGDLYDYVERKGKLSETESRSIFHDLINCLNYLHERGFSHRDIIRPENVLLDSSFRIKLIGFQFAHLRFDEIELARKLANTKAQYISPEYMAPEILSSSAVCTPAIDVWSAGVLLYYILTGLLPFIDNSLVRLFKKIQAGLFELPCELPDDARDLIVRMLKVNPVERANVKQILSHQWLQRQCAMVEPNEMAASESEDILDDNALNECLLLHLHEVQNDIVQLRFNIRYKFCYQSATYWLINENFDKYKNLDLKLNSKAPKVSMNRLRQMVDHQSKNSIALRRRHTFMVSRGAAPNPPKVAVNSCKSKLDDGKCAITTSLDGESEQSSESKKRNKLVKARKDASIAEAASRVLTKLPDTADVPMWRAKSKSHFNLRRIFSKPQIADDRSNSGKSIESNSDCGRSCQQVLSHKSSSSSLKKSLSRRLSFGFSTKFLGKNLSQINSASTVNKSKSEDVMGKRVYPPPRRDQSQSSLADTTDSDEQRVNRAKAIRFDSTELDQADGQQPWRDNGSDTGTPSLPCSSRKVKPIKDSVPSTDSMRDQAVKINRQKAIPLTGSSVAIITRYSNYEECRDEAARLLAKKGINCKAEKHKMRCCVSAMNEILLAFHAEFLTFPSLNGGSFVMIKVKKLRGNNEDFHVIADFLTTRFERRHLQRSQHKH